MVPTPTKVETLSIPAVIIGYWRLCWLLRPGELTGRGACGADLAWALAALLWLSRRPAELPFPHSWRAMNPHALSLSPPWPDLSRLHVPGPPLFFSAHTPPQLYHTDCDMRARAHTHTHTHSSTQANHLGVILDPSISFLHLTP